MGQRVNIDGLADAVMRELEHYADTTTDGVKAAVKKAANTVKKEITAGAPSRSGKYAKSWRTKTVKEIAYDRWNASECVQHLDDEGFTMVNFGQGYTSMSNPTKDLMRLTLEKKLAHGGHPVLRWMMDDKYAFRCFLLRLGFIGAEYKAERKILLKNLTGSSAFRNGGADHAVSE